MSMCAMKCVHHYACLTGHSIAMALCEKYRVKISSVHDVRCVVFAAINAILCPLCC